MDESATEDYQYRSRRKALGLSNIRRGALLIFAMTAAIIFVAAFFMALTH